MKPSANASFENNNIYYKYFSTSFLNFRIHEGGGQNIELTFYSHHSTYTSSYRIKRIVYVADGCGGQ